MTQWCFGPALIDRGFRLSGGVCELANALEGSGSKEELFTSQACKSIGGVWKGGHDISGHVFILVLGSAFLILEMLPVWKGWKEGESVEGGRADTEEQSGDDESFGKWPLAVVVGLSFWMLLMTAAYFHTWFEKVRVFIGTKLGHLLTTDSSLVSWWHFLVSLSYIFYPGLFHAWRASWELQESSPCIIIYSPPQKH